jgi:hypothetical protein
MACVEDAVSHELSRHLRRHRHQQRVHAVLYLCHAHVLVSLRLHLYANIQGNTCIGGWDLAKWLERCASISGGSELTFCSDLLLTARGGST